MRISTNGGVSHLTCLAFYAITHVDRWGTLELEPEVERILNIMKTESSNPYTCVMRCRRIYRIGNYSDTESN